MKNAKLESNPWKQGDDRFAGFVQQSRLRIHAWSLTWWIWFLPGVHGSG